jgi:hypothetical protein
VLTVLAAVLPACPAGPNGPGGGAGGYADLDREHFNRLAVRLNLPLFWAADADGDGAVDPGETASLMFYPTEGHWVAGGAFTPAFDAAYAAMKALAAESDPYAGLDPAEATRRRLVDEELDQGYPTLVWNDLSDLTPPHRAFLERMLEVGAAIDRLYARQVGSAALADRLPADDAASASLFRRNWGVTCQAPRTEGNPACSAIPGAPEQPVGAYPAEMQADGAFCEALAALPDSARLLDPFTVVRIVDGAPSAVPLPEAYPNEMGAVAAGLRAAAEGIGEDPSESAMVTYLTAAAEAFRTNDWQPADEAWSRMNAGNSAWYVRVGPDETYWEPCNRKAGFHLTLARISPASIAWQDRLSPVRQEMEDTLAELIGAPYAAREVAFHLPDFIDIVTNHGDDRDPMGATIGQSLPNWGPVANEGRGRTVVMNNLYTDTDSIRMFRARAAALFDAAAAAGYPEDPDPGSLATILHEATHNLGPSHEYAFEGLTDDDAFGGPLATVMEELKAQTGALFFLELLVDRGIVTPEFARQCFTHSFAWAFGHISRGMYAESGSPKPYSQLAAIQIGMLLDAGALRWDPDALAANGTDRGAFSIDFDALPGAARDMMRRAGRIKATNDRAAAEELVRRYVDGDVVPMSTITERVLRDPKTAFTYGLAY